MTPHLSAVHRAGTTNKMPGGDMSRPSGASVGLPDWMHRAVEAGAVSVSPSWGGSSLMRYACTSPATLGEGSEFGRAQVREDWTMQAAKSRPPTPHARGAEAEPEEAPGAGTGDAQLLEGCRHRSDDRLKPSHHTDVPPSAAAGPTSTRLISFAESIWGAIRSEAGPSCRWTARPRQAEPDALRPTEWSTEARNAGGRPIRPAVRCRFTAVAFTTRIAGARAPGRLTRLTGLNMTSVTRLNSEIRRAPGRPSTFTQQLADGICERLACGESLRRICADEGMPDKATVIRWLAKHDTFRASYSHARMVQADGWADEILDLARADPPRSPVTGRCDPVAARHIRNRVGTLRWMLEKLIPKKFGCGGCSGDCRKPSRRQPVAF